MDEIGPFALLALVWWVMSLFGEAKKRQQQGKGRPPVQRPAASRSQLPPQRPTLADPSQREGSRLEQILREMERALEQTTQVPAPEPEPRGSWDTGLEEIEEVEALDSYQPEVASHEDFSNFERPEREVIVLGGDQEELQRRRMNYAEVRTHALTKADHDRFDAKIRKPQVLAEVAQAPPPSARTERLRQAIIWREVLGQPVALRGEERS